MRPSGKITIGSNTSAVKAVEVTNEPSNATERILPHSKEYRMVVYEANKDRPTCSTHPT